MRITVLGSGTSTGVPVIGCDCDVCRSAAPENKRLRCSIYIEHGDSKILVDCSSDFRQQMLRYAVPRLDAILVTHGHADHIGGIDDLRAYNHVQKAPIPIFGSDETLDVIRERFDYCFNPKQLGGGVTQMALKEIKSGETFEIGDLKIMPIHVKHGILDILGFRFGDDLAYLTDVSAVPDESLELVRGVDTLIVDALRHKPHATHFTLEEALAFSREIKPRQTWFTHITDHLEHHDTNASLPPEAQLLHDGQVLHFDDTP
jgi:phosphoribosyl 1,2-cyclic phosphate phosphodiesterase